MEMLVTEDYLQKALKRRHKSFHFLQIAAPIFLLILTRLRMPVSTTFILLTSFAASPAAVGKVLAKVCLDMY